MENFLLIVEDEQKIAELLKDYLKKYFDRVDIVNNGSLVLNLVKEQQPSFIILDVMLPGIDGYTLCSKIKASYNIPILFLSARTMEDDKIQGLEQGADDYVVKPFSMREVEARVKSILKRYNSNAIPSKSHLIVNGVELDQASHEVKVADKIVNLTKTEFDILELMMHQPGMVFERMLLVQKVMGYEYEGYERNIDAHIKNIRRKISKVTKEEKIESIYGIGYKFLEK